MKLCIVFHYKITLLSNWNINCEKEKNNKDFHEEDKH